MVIGVRGYLFRQILEITHLHAIVYCEIRTRKFRTTYMIDILRSIIIVVDLAVVGLSWEPDILIAQHLIDVSCMYIRPVIAGWSLNTAHFCMPHSKPPPPRPIHFVFILYIFRIVYKMAEYRYISLLLPWIPCRVGTNLAIHSQPVLPKIVNTPMTDTALATQISPIFGPFIHNVWVSRPHVTAAHTCITSDYKTIDHLHKLIK